MNTHNHYSIIVAEQWDRATKNQSADSWRYVAQLASSIADTVETLEPDSMLGPAMRGIYQEAYKRMEEQQ